MNTETGRPHIALLVPDGVGVRNFVLGPFLKLAQEQAHVTVYHTIPADRLPLYAGAFDGNISWQPLREYRETPLSFTLRWALAYGQMYWADTASMQYTRKRKCGKSLRSRAVHTTARLLGRACAHPSGLQALDAAHCRTVAGLPEVEYYRLEFERSRPDVLFCSHQRPPSILPPVLAARSLGIPAVTFIFSWDNLTSKGRIAAPFDHYFVWSDLMRRELLRYYPGVSPHCIHVVGTPQFDPYADECLVWPRDEFFRRIGADPKRPLICYSGGDHGTCPEDPEHVRILMQLIRNREIRRNPQVLVRPAPVDDGARYSAVRTAFPEMLFAQPAWLHSGRDWSRVIPSHDDVRFLINLTQHVDLNVNMASTMTLDFAIHDKPVVNIAFDTSNPPRFGKPIWDVYYQYNHYRPVVELGAARLARSSRELAAHVNAYLEDPELDRESRRNLVDLEIGVAIGNASSHIVKALTTIETLSRQPRPEFGQ